MPTRAAIYIRKSRKEADRPGHRLTAQRQQLPDHARAQGWQVEVYDDGHASAARGKAADLPQRSRLEADIRAGRVDLVLCIELSRLSRDESLQDYVAWLHLCAEHGVKLATPSRILDPSHPSDWMLLLMEGGFSSVEMKVLQARMAEGRRQAKREGRYLAGNPPAPYRYDKGRGGLVIDPAELPRMKRLFEMAERKSTRDIAAELGLPVITVRRALAADRLVMYQGLARDPDTGETIPAQWPSVIDADQAERILAARKQRRKAPRRTHAGLLSNLGLFFCGYCGKTIRAWKASRARRDGTRIDYYGCTAKDTRRLCDSSRMVPQSVVNERVIENLLGTLDQLGDLKRWWHATREGDVTSRDAELDAAESVLSARKSRLIAAIAEGIISFADAKEQRRQIESELETVRSERRQIADQAAEPDWEALSLTRDDWDLLEEDERREVLSLAIRQIRMFKSYALIDYHFPRSPDGSTTSRIHLPPVRRNGSRPAY